ncbi:MAG: alkaline phosphatase family protein, partial [Nitrospiria bacterium]
DVKTYDQKPAMSAFEVCDEVIRQVKRNRFDFICINFANPDMVGHSGILDAAVKAVMAVDRSLKKTVNATLEAGGAVIITADHGNLEQMIDYETGEPHTAHTTNPVPLILCSGEDYKLRTGVHANIAPTILELMQIPKPPEMDQDSLIFDQD